MKRILFFIAFSGWLTSHGQVYIQTTLPTVGLVQKNQLWNLVLVNGTTTSMEGKLELVLHDRQTGMEMMTATTSKFTLPKGSLSLTVNNLNPVQYNYIGMDAAVMLNGLLPAGAYTACYSFLQVSGEKQEELGEECVTFDIEPLSPPMLIFPADSAKLESLPNQFTWMPPTPTGMINRLRYEILITEIREGQAATEAIQFNPPFYTTGLLQNNFLGYPASSPAFEKDKWYAWQVIAMDDKNYAGKTEVWVFTVTNPKPVDLMVKGAPFIKMNSGDPASGIAPNGILKLSYFNRGADVSGVLTITNISDSDSPAKPVTINVKLVPGENQLQIPLKKQISINESSTYKAEMISSGGERQSVLFTIKFFGEKK